MEHYDVEPGEYDEDANEHGALRAIETQLSRLGHIAEAISEHAESQRQIADALNRIADILGGLAQTWRSSLPDNSPSARAKRTLEEAKDILNIHGAS